MALGKLEPLWEKTFLFSNFEGMTLGPQLDNGDNTLLLVSDDHGGINQSLYILHLSGRIPEPSMLAIFSIMVLLTSRRLDRHLGVV